jgi:hypothetical protein
MGKGHVKLKLYLIILKITTFIKEWFSKWSPYKILHPILLPFLCGTIYADKVSKSNPWMYKV